MEPLDPLTAARELVERFLADRPERTLQAYRLDLEDFGRFAGEALAVAVGRLLAGGPAAADYLALQYAVDLRHRARAPATISRRMATLRALVSSAREAGLIDWLLAAPREEDVAAGGRAGQASYLLPRHPSEVDRLDLQHYALTAALGATHRAPVAGPARILDAGCGTGQWGFDLSTQFPDALVIGLDLVPGKPGGPAGHRFVRGNLLRGLPFLDRRFDLVHQRLLVSGVPLASWPAVVAELARVTRPGGWVELVEPMANFDRPGPATERLLGLTKAFARSLGLDTEGAIPNALGAYLREAGLADVGTEALEVPVGHWGGDVGALMATDIRAGFTRVCEVLQARSGLAEEEGRALIERAQVEWEEHETAWTFALAWGRRDDR
ncbi:MAG TPA: methyltransferase domain-containing protein [Candidatus Dormibacteraeota bacterium]